MRNHGGDIGRGNESDKRGASDSAGALSAVWKLNSMEAGGALASAESFSSTSHRPSRDRSKTGQGRWQLGLVFLERREGPLLGEPLPGHRKTLLSYPSFYTFSELSEKRVQFYWGRSEHFKASMWELSNIKGRW